MNPELVWTHFTPQQLQEVLMESDWYFSIDTIRRLMQDVGYRRYQLRKQLALGKHPDQDTQFQNILRIKQDYLASSDVIISIDTKKRELLGTFYRPGTTYRRQPTLVYDHDFPSAGTGKVIPYGIYDLKSNQGFVNLGSSIDTSAFAGDSIAWWWENYGQFQYPLARSICLLADGGGSNSCRQYLFKEDLQRLADRFGITFRMAHYPPHCSKYNPIEHRLFPHLTRALTGAVLDSKAKVSQLLEQTRTKTGLRVIVGSTETTYERGRKCAEEFKYQTPIQFDELLPLWNYRAIPRTA